MYNQNGYGSSNVLQKLITHNFILNNFYALKLKENHYCRAILVEDFLKQGKYIVYRQRPFPCI